MKVEEMRTKTNSELAKRADKLRVQLAEARTGRFLGEVKNVKAIKALRTELAQVMTILREQADDKKEVN